MPQPHPGWYADPLGDHDVRWWDGSAWTDTVRTGPFQGTASLTPVPVPREETVLWHRGDELLTTHRAVLREGRRPVDVPWWAVRGVDVRGTDLVLLIGYPGYTDKTERRIKGLANAPELAALALAWARRHHRLLTQR
ncbi:MAG: DUF2510 domain-containing protein [Nocardioidaceae bacterium]